MSENLTYTDRVLDLWTDLIGCLDLHIEHERSEPDNVTVFEGVSQQLDYHRVFGGQLLGQFIRAASLACPDKTVKSLHAVFAREGRAAAPVRYQATRQHEGRSFASLTITAQQPHAVLASSSVSMHIVEDGPENQDCQAVPALLDETHPVWFHQPFRTDQWFLLRQHSPVLAHGRCFGRGDVVNEDGTLVASYAQEALLRFRDGAGR